MPRRSRKDPGITGDDPSCAPARVDFGGIVKEINLAYMPEAAVGDYVLVHVGFAISVARRGGGERVFEYLEAIGELEAELGAEREAVR